MNYTLGLYLMIGDTEKAAYSLLPRKEGINIYGPIFPHMGEIGNELSELHTNDIQILEKTLKGLHHSKVVQRYLLQSFIKTKSWTKAWGSVPYRKRQFIVQAAGSLLWNRQSHTNVGNLSSSEESQPFIGSADGSLLDKYLMDLKLICSYVPTVDQESIGKNLNLVGLGIETVSGTRQQIVAATEFDQAGNTLSFGLPRGSYATMFLRELSNGGIVG